MISFKLDKNACEIEFRHAEHGWRSRDELISDVLLWTPT